MPVYRAVFEAFANALRHRDYTVIGSEVHVDMFDDKLEIYSPGGIVDRTLIQNRDIDKVLSTRRNPIIAEIFHRLDFVERRGSGLQKIKDETANLYGYTVGIAVVSLNRMGMRLAGNMPLRLRYLCKSIPGICVKSTV
jgi:predicted HTH transcriptional regulator